MLTDEREKLFFHVLDLFARCDVRVCSVEFRTEVHDAFVEDVLDFQWERIGERVPHGLIFLEIEVSLEESRRVRCWSIGDAWIT